ncbi:hypothetical protein BJ742DRAFT_871082, partial [Cladochytrium replicatum]
MTEDRDTGYAGCMVAEAVSFCGACERDSGRRFGNCGGVDTTVARERLKGYNPGKAANRSVAQQSALFNFLQFALIFALYALPQSYSNKLLSDPCCALIIMASSIHNRARSVESLRPKNSQLLARWNAYTSQNQSTSASPSHFGAITLPRNMSVPDTPTTPTPFGAFTLPRNMSVPDTTTTPSTPSTPGIPSPTQPFSTFSPHPCPLSDTPLESELRNTFESESPYDMLGIVLKDFPRLCNRITVETGVPPEVADTYRGYPHHPVRRLPARVWDALDEGSRVVLELARWFETPAMNDALMKLCVERLDVPHELDPTRNEEELEPIWKTILPVPPATRIHMHPSGMLSAPNLLPPPRIDSRPLSIAGLTPMQILPKLSVGSTTVRVLRAVSVGVVLTAKYYLHSLLLQPLVLLSRDDGDSEDAWTVRIRIHPGSAVHVTHTRRERSIHDARKEWFRFRWEISMAFDWGLVLQSAMLRASDLEVDEGSFSSGDERGRRLRFAFAGGRTLLLEQKVPEERQGEYNYQWRGRGEGAEAVTLGRRISKSRRGRSPGGRGMPALFVGEGKGNGGGGVLRLPVVASPIVRESTQQKPTFERGTTERGTAERSSGVIASIQCYLSFLGHPVPAIPLSPDLYALTCYVFRDGVTVLQEVLLRLLRACHHQCILTSLIGSSLAVSSTLPSSSPY